MDEQTFTKEVLASGFSAPERFEREANLYNAEHTHEFDVEAYIVSGELTVTTADGATICRAGDRFSLARGIPHEERYGADSTEILVAKRTS
ncbi:MAG: cupin domain-containing protein [Gammaproteobacteria bacterium]